MAKPSRPRRQKKADRLLNPGSTGSEIECDYGIAPLDRAAIEMDAKWGVDKLPELVSVETAARYGKAMAHLNECIQASDPAKCAAAAQNCIKGLTVMDAEATAAGKPQATGDFWEYAIPELDGRDALHFGILKDGLEWQAAKAARPDLTFFTMREVAIALQMKIASPMLMEVKDRFPGATVTNIRPNPPVDYANGGDPIPF